MLEDAELALVWPLYEQAIRSAKAAAHPLDDETKTEIFRPFRDAYERITGSGDEDAAVVVMHHRLSTYGPPCAQCGKPLRTPQAALCAACGAAR
jgi:hypothetical protein